MADAEARGGAGRLVAGVVGFLVLAGLITTATLVIGSSEPAAAADLERFSSCTELETWTTDVIEAQQTGVDATGGPVTTAVGRLEEATAALDSATSAGAAGGGEGAASAPVPAAAQEANAADDTGGTGGTNTVVAGVDEIDVIDQVGPDRLLVSRNGALALVDLSGRSVVAELTGVPFDARISVAGDLAWIAGSSIDGTGTTVRRVRIGTDALTEEGSWSTPGYLLDARRTGDRLHVVVVDQPYETGAIPFEGGPVPCEDVWHPTAEVTSPAATLVATLPATGELAPTAVAEVTGSAGNILVTADSLYVATETWPGGEGGQITTGLHRFDLDSLTPTGSGSVPGQVAGRFALDEHDGYLRVATSLASFGPMVFEGDMLPMPPVDAGVATDEAARTDAVTAAPSAGEPAIASAAAQETGPAVPETTIPGDETTTSVPTTSTTTPEETTTSTTEPETTTTAPETTETTVPETTETTETTVEPAEGPEDALAEVFVLDTDGDLDVVGRTGRFGHDFETIQGVRFVDDVAYVVTFRQTDPFFVVDLANASAPRVVGELAIPGFSAYLHPAGDGRVVGFGPDGNGAVAARLFDVTDPAAPRLLDELRLGDDSAIVWDPHAYVALDGGRFAVPVNDWPDVSGCVPIPVPDPAPTPTPAPEPRPVDPGIGDGSGPPVTIEPLPVDPGIGDGSSGSSGGGVSIEPLPVDPGFVPTQPCEPVFSGGGSGAAVLAVEGDHLVEVDRATVETDGSVNAERVVLAPDGTWLVLSWDRIVPTDGGEAIVLPADPASGIVID